MGNSPDRVWEFSHILQVVVAFAYVEIQLFKRTINKIKLIHCTGNCKSQIMFKKMHFKKQCSKISFPVLNYLFAPILKTLKLKVFIYLERITLSLIKYK